MTHTWMFIRKTHLSSSVFSLQLPCNIRGTKDKISSTKAAVMMAWPKFSWRTPASPRRRKAIPTPGRVGEKLRAKPQEIWIQTIGSFSLTLVGLSHLLVPALFQLQRPVGRTWAATGMQLKNAWMKRLKRRSPKIAGKNWPENIWKLGSVCVIIGSFRIDRKMSTALGWTKLLKLPHP